MDFLVPAARLLLTLDPQADLGHARRVTRLSLTLAPLAGHHLDPHDLIFAAMLHDVGKVSLHHLTQLPRSLTPEERRDLQRHPQIGVTLLASQGAAVRRAVGHHHERWDGGGYPHGLRGPAISRAARVIALADAYDALTSDRPYRRAWQPEQARAYLLATQGQFDPRVLEAFARLCRCDSTPGLGAA